MLAHTSDPHAHTRSSTLVQSRDTCSTLLPALACQFYEGLAQRAAAKGHCVDAFMGCLDQCGFSEMRELVESTGLLSVGVHRGEGGAVVAATTEISEMRHAVYVHSRATLWGSFSTLAVLAASAQAALRC